MRSIAHNFQVGQLRQHGRYGFGSVRAVEARPGSADKITVLYLGGFVSFLAGSMDSRDWVPVGHTVSELLDDGGAGEPGDLHDDLG